MEVLLLGAILGEEQMETGMEIGVGILPPPIEMEPGLDLIISAIFVTLLAIAIRIAASILMIVLVIVFAEIVMENMFHHVWRKIVTGKKGLGLWQWGPISKILTCLPHKDQIILPHILLIIIQVMLDILPLTIEILGKDGIKTIIIGLLTRAGLASQDIGEMTNGTFQIGLTGKVGLDTIEIIGQIDQEVDTRETE